ncbi:hypothetical protein Tco_0145638 [Tanacetum coccineum]|uniref:Uncharacterized protein n=1 Tax=Tanacetum coccineum TaxID=301880 RepID=A0ABQ5DHF0_9ASTR
MWIDEIHPLLLGPPILWSVYSSKSKPADGPCKQSSSSSLNHSGFVSIEQQYGIRSQDQRNTEEKFDEFCLWSERWTVVEYQNKVLFTDTDCLVLSEEFQLPDASQVGTKNFFGNMISTHSPYRLATRTKGYLLRSKSNLDDPPDGNRRMAHCEIQNISTKLAMEWSVDGLPLKIMQKSLLSFKRHEHEVRTQSCTITLFVLEGNSRNTKSSLKLKFEIKLALIHAVRTLLCVDDFAVGCILLAVLLMNSLFLLTFHPVYADDVLTLPHWSFQLGSSENINYFPFPLIICCGILFVNPKPTSIAKSTEVPNWVDSYARRDANSSSYQKGHRQVEGIDYVRYSAPAGQNRVYVTKTKDLKILTSKAWLQSGERLCMDHSWLLRALIPWDYNFGTGLWDDHHLWVNQIMPGVLNLSSGHGISSEGPDIIGLQFSGLFPDIKLLHWTSHLNASQENFHVSKGATNLGLWKSTQVDVNFGREGLIYTAVQKKQTIVDNSFQLRPSMLLLLAAVLRMLMPSSGTLSLPVLPRIDRVALFCWVYSLYLMLFLRLLDALFLLIAMDYAADSVNMLSGIITSAGGSISVIRVFVSC